MLTSGHIKLFAWSGKLDVKYTPDCTISESILQKIFGEELTELPPQTPPPLLSRASPSILGGFAHSIWASPSVFMPSSKTCHENSWIRRPC